MKWAERKDIREVKVVCESERLQKWKEHFMNMVAKPSEITDKLIKEMINDQQDIKLGNFTEKELYATQKTIKGYILPFQKKGDFRITKKLW